MVYYHMNCLLACLLLFLLNTPSYQSSRVYGLARRSFRFYSSLFLLVENDFFPSTSGASLKCGILLQSIPKQWHHVVVKWKTFETQKLSLQVVHRIRKRRSIHKYHPFGVVLLHFFLVSITNQKTKVL